MGSNWSLLVWLQINIFTVYQLSTGLVLIVLSIDYPSWQWTNWTNKLQMKLLRYFARVCDRHNGQCDVLLVIAVALPLMIKTASSFKSLILIIII